MSDEYRHEWKAERGYYESSPEFRWLSDEECNWWETEKRAHRERLVASLPRTERVWLSAFGLAPPALTASRIDKDVVKERVDMVDLVTRHGAKMRIFGKKATGTCPLHADRLASFSIDTERKLWHCFAGCGGGDCFTFVQRVEECTFYEAVKILNSEY